MSQPGSRRSLDGLQATMEVAGPLQPRDEAKATTWFAKASSRWGEMENASGFFYMQKGGISNHV
jgi:hypothetical protein